MFCVYTENNSLTLCHCSVTEIVFKHLNDQFISRVHTDALFEVRIHIIFSVKSDMTQINIRLQTVNICPGNDSLFHCIDQGKTCLVASENTLQLLPVRSLICCRQSHHKLRRKVLDHSFQHRCDGMMRFIDHNISILVLSILRIISHHIRIGADFDLIFIFSQGILDPLMPVADNIRIRRQYQCPKIRSPGCKFLDILFYDLRFSACRGKYDQKSMNPFRSFLFHIPESRKLMIVQLYFSVQRKSVFPESSGIPSEISPDIIFDPVFKY